MRMSDWSSDVCSSDLRRTALRHELSLVPVLGVMMLAACAAPDAGQAVKPIPVSTLGLGSVSSPNIDATWWTSLGDPQLDRIMSGALSGSPRLDAALAREIGRAWGRERVGQYGW